MNKRNIILMSGVFSMISLFSVIVFMLILPQSVSVTQMDSYEDNEKEDYQFVPTKDISEEALSYEYQVTAEDIEEFKIKNQYIAGNENPFYNEN